MSQPVVQRDRSAVRSVGVGFFVIALLITAVPLSVAWFGYDRTEFEKVATSLAQPLFVVLTLLMSASMAMHRLRPRLVAAVIGHVALLGWLLSTPAISNRLAMFYEGQYRELDVVEKPFDVVFVLGGGTTTSPSNRAQVGASGDRVVYAARLFLQKSTSRLVALGGSISSVDDEQREKVRDGSAEALALWKDLGVPTAKIDRLPGNNTTEEMESISDKQELWEGKRCGLVTSAFHMPRAMRLAKKKSLDLVPLPCDFKGRQERWTVQSWLPDANSLGLSQLLIKEWIAERLDR